MLTQIPNPPTFLYVLTNGATHSSSLLQMGLLPPSIPHALKWNFSSPFFHLGRMASLYNQKNVSISSRATILDFSKGSFNDPSIHAPKVHSSFIQFIPPTSSFNPQLHALTNGLQKIFSFSKFVFFN
jgi:hypothetical protein